MWSRISRSGIGFPGGSDNESAYSEGDRRKSGLGREPGEGNDYPTPVSLPGNSKDREAWRGLQSMRITESDTLSD